MIDVMICVNKLMFENQLISIGHQMETEPLRHVDVLVMPTCFGNRAVGQEK